MNRKLKDGFYISAYCDIDSLGNILNTSIRHDQSIAVWKVEEKNVLLLKHLELERITGEKHHRTPFFSLEDFYAFIDKGLVPYNITHDDIQGFIGMKDIDKNLKVELDDNISLHSICHLYASLGMNSEYFYNEKILGLSLDAEPDVLYELNAKEKNYFAGAYSQYGNVELFPISSPGVLWTTAVDELKMQEGTLMALAFASKSKSFLDYPVEYKIQVKEDHLSVQNYVRNICRDILNYTEKDVGTKFNYYDKRFTEYENKVSMIMKIVQKWSLQILDYCIQNVIEKYGIEPKETMLALSGGYALNCPTNTYIMQKYNFKKQLILPSVNDSGQSIGLGLYYFYKKIHKVNFCFSCAYLGNSYVNYNSKFDYYIKSKYDGLDYFVDDIQNNPIIWFFGHAESGPRALGHRSILADPRNKHSKELLNRIKQREWWRPVAPIILEEECNEWFENSFSSKYMLNNFKINSEKKKYVPSILHLDDTCRVQTIGRENNLLYQALKLFYKKTNVPIICNTSLNDKGEPIIDTIDEAFNFALRKRIKIMYINGIRCELYRFEDYIENKPLNRWNDLFIQYGGSKQICKKVNPFNVLSNEYYMYTNTGISKKIDVTNEQNYKIFKRYVNKLNKLYNEKIGNDDKNNKVDGIK